MLPTRSAAAINGGHNYIYISSDDESSPPPRRPARTTAVAATRSPDAGSRKRQRRSADPPSAAPVIDHTAELVALRQQLEGKDATIQALRLHAEEMKKTALKVASRKPESDLKIWAAAQLEDACCEICTETYWTPFMLPCGHAFCQGCLTDWFTIALLQHQGAHPGHALQPALPPHLMVAMRNPRYHAYLGNYIETNFPQPQYTCPRCRNSVRSAPVEDFPLKNMVRSLAAAAGTAVPAEEADGQRNRTGADPWEGFFPSQ